MIAPTRIQSASTALLLAGVASIFGMAAAFADSQSKSITEFTVPGGSDTLPESINAKGDVTGYYVDGTGAHGFVRKHDGTIVTFDPKASVSTVPSSINSAGVITGDYSRNSQRPIYHGFVRAPGGGGFTTIDVPGANNTSPLCINAGGTIVGQYEVENSGYFGFIRAPDGTITQVDVNGESPVPQSINDSNTITGGYGGGSGFVQTGDGATTIFAPPDATLTLPTSINSAGAVAGYFQNTLGGPDHGFVRAADGSITTFDPKGSTETFVMSINDAGTIVGNYSVKGGYPLGFVRTPDGHIRTLTVPNSNATWPVGINAAGAVTGNFGGPNPVAGFIAQE